MSTTSSNEYPILSPHPRRAALRLVCSYCGWDIDRRSRLPVKTPPPTPADGETPPVSHGICRACLERFEPQWTGQDFDSYLNRFDVPVLITDTQRRVLAANDALVTLAGRPLDELRGLRAGEALECVHAAHPAGCGQAVHCRTCTIRLLVERCIEEGVDTEDEPASLTRPGGPVQCYVSVRRVGNAVHVTLRPADEA